MTCVLDKIEFGLDINAVQEIVRLPQITPVPKAPSYVEGVANLRGNVLPIINSRAALRHESQRESGEQPGRGGRTQRQADRIDRRRRPRSHARQCQGRERRPRWCKAWMASSSGYCQARLRSSPGDALGPKRLARRHGHGAGLPRCLQAASRGCGRRRTTMPPSRPRRRTTSS